MRILGIDPGSNVTGYGMVEKTGGRLVHICNGSINVSQRYELKSKLKMIFDELNRVLKEFRPDAVALEEIFYGRNVKSSIILGHARGVALLCTAEHGVPLFEYSPSRIKQAVVGYGNATKEQVQKMVKALLKMNALPKPDASDALAAAICHIHHYKIQVMTQKQRLKSKKLLTFD